MINRGDIMTQEEAEELINILKELYTKCLKIPFPSQTLEYECKAVSEKSLFLINVYRSGRNNKKCTFQARTKGKNEVLMRLDVNPSPHRNPDNTMIYGSHLHIFKEGYGMTYAFPFDVEDDNLTSNFIQFLNHFNVIHDTIEVVQEDSLFT